MNRELKPLTGIRGIAALLIAGYHFTITKAGNLEHLVSVERAYLAVDAFFVLSGFVLALSYAKSFSGGVRAKNYRNFLVKRFLRIYPAYFCILLLYVAKLVVNVSGDGALAQFSVLDFISNFLMLNTWAIDAKTIIGPSWSVCVEILCYFLFPGMIAIIARTRVSAIATIVIALLGIIAVALSGHGAAGELDVVFGDTLYPVLRAVCGFWIGIAGYYLWTNTGLVTDTGSGAYLSLALIGMVASIAFGASDLVVYVFIAAAVILTATQSEASQTLFGNRVSHFLGKVSYSLYLIHTLLISIFVKFVPLLTPKIGYAAAYISTLLIYLAFSVVAAAVSYSLFEVRARKLLEVLIFRPVPAAVALTEIAAIIENPAGAEPPVAP
ncbi:peptidoglycan/LPS O-acetylase OafA/YrhL [Rhizobium leguminosarum]|uniref:acyltransferase family protein n=1 Tax=Rhizobium leguminosarum TaxID=384 RepID=UPI0024B39707|nr:acyltransferase [Rhizobium leguminosarum]WHO84303.1 acyltransferase [Rhizobium leguminosarum]